MGQGSAKIGRKVDVGVMIFLGLPSAVFSIHGELIDLKDSLCMSWPI